MLFLQTINQQLARFCAGISLIGLLLILLTTTLDVLTRALFRLTHAWLNWHMQGAIELVSYLLTITLLSAFVAWIEKVHLVLDFLPLSPNSIYAKSLHALNLILCGAIGTQLALENIELMKDAYAYGERSQDLALPMHYIYAIWIALSVALILRSFFELCVIPIIQPRGQGDD